MITGRKWLYVCCFLFAIVFLGCAGPRIVMEPADVQALIDDARDSVSLAQETGAHELAPEQVARAESLLTRAEQAAKDEKRAAESIKLASEARVEAEVAYAVSRQAKIHEQELQQISSEKAAQLAALQMAQEMAREAEKDRAREAQEYARKLDQLYTEKEEELASVRADLEAAEYRAAHRERELAEAKSEWEAAKRKFEETMEETRTYSEKTSQMEEELADTQAALEAAENDFRKAEAKVKVYSERIAALEREREKKIAVHVAREDAAEKKAERVKARRETLQGEASLETLEEVRKALEGWRIAWERKDAARYVLYYADDAQIRKLVIAQGKEQVQQLSKAEMRGEMERFFTGGAKFSVKGPRLEAGSYAVRATFEFFKDVPVDAYEDRADTIKHDKWIKELLFREVKGEWKIVSEDWSIYHDIPEYADR